MHMQRIWAGRLGVWKCVSRLCFSFSCLIFNRSLRNFTPKSRSFLRSPPESCADNNFLRASLILLLLRTIHCTHKSMSTQKESAKYTTMRSLCTSHEWSPLLAGISWIWCWHQWRIPSEYEIITQKFNIVDKIVSANEGIATTAIQTKLNIIQQEDYYNLYSCRLFLRSTVFYFCEILFQSKEKWKLFVEDHMSFNKLYDILSIHCND